MNEALEKAVRIVGSQVKLASLIGKKQGHIWNWLHRDERVPGEVVLDIEKATDFQVTRHELRPDLYPESDDSLSRRQTDPHTEAG